MMKLMYSPASPFARKVRMAAHELGLADQIEVVSVDTAPGKPNAELAKQNPMRKIPALVLDDGTALFDSVVICEYLNAKANGKLYPQGADRWDVLAEASTANGMCEASLLARYETFLRPEPQRWGAWTEHQMGHIESGLQWFDARAAGLKRDVDIAHLTLASTLGYLDYRFTEYNWRSHAPKIAEWFGAFAKRPSFVETMPAVPK